MVRQYSIELRVDFADEGKYKAIEEALVAHAVALNATAQLLADQARPQIAVVSDDFFKKHEDIEVLTNTVLKGQQLIASDTDNQTAVSDEMLEALGGK